MDIKHITLGGLLFITSLSAFAAIDTTKNEKSTETSSEKVFTFTDTSTSISNSLESVKDSVDSFDDSFHLNLKSANFLPSLKVEYITGGLDRHDHTLMTPSGSNGSPLDVNLQHADVFSYYDIRADNKVYLDLGLGFRQYDGQISNTNDVLGGSSNNYYSVNSTMPMMYGDIYYMLNSNSITQSKVGVFTKNSSMFNNDINETFVYYSTSFRNLDNLNFVAGYGMSNLSINREKNQNFNNNDSYNFKNEGVGLKMIYFY